MRIDMRYGLLVGGTTWAESVLCRPIDRWDRAATRRCLRGPLEQFKATMRFKTSLKLFHP
jgi:hypothetical protein